jgi:hypothetical protein
MVTVYFDYERLEVTPLAAECLRKKLAEGGVSCGAAVVGVCPDHEHQADIVWNFNGCPSVEITFSREELGRVDGAERVAIQFVKEWQQRIQTPPTPCDRCA